MLVDQTAVRSARRAEGGALEGRRPQTPERKLGVMDQNSASWNRLAHWFGLMEALKKAA
jgi:hypothetical protein